MLNNKKLLGEVFLVDEKGENYIVYVHQQKTWILPYKDVRIALGMYQPTTFKGKTLKKILPLLVKIVFIRKLIKAEKVKLSLNSDIKEYINQHIDTNTKYQIAGYIGDESTEDNNKITFQIYDKEKIIEYIKVTKSEKVKTNFRIENTAIENLINKGIKNVPEITFIKEIDEMYMYTQSTRKNIDENICLVFDERHLELVQDIVDKTKYKQDYEKTDFYRNLEYVKQHTLKDNVILGRAIKLIEEELKEKELEYAFSHGDYTPWNMYFEKKELQIFDFEHSSFSKPCYIDVFHYITQMSLLGYRNNAKQTIKLYEKEKLLIDKYVDNADFTYLCYLIDIIGFYLKRTTSTNKIVDKEYSQWIIIIEYLLEKLEKTA